MICGPKDDGSFFFALRSGRSLRSAAAHRAARRREASCADHDAAKRGVIEREHANPPCYRAAAVERRSGLDHTLLAVVVALTIEDSQMEGR
jgi:hypothetical protein